MRAPDLVSATPLTAGVTESFRRMVADGFGVRDNSELVNAYRGKPKA